MVKELICLVCPRGCRLKIDQEGNITGNFCARGIPYAEQEMKNPKRNLAFALKVKGHSHRLPVKTDKPIAKDLLIKLAAFLEDYEAVPPINFHDVVIKNVLGTDVNIIATKNVK
ncbi:MAG TPA: DUF1667 domain-containing protein [Bacilli bacterium]|nr:DUF1667 domain-containing protein [Bacilli bacterium]